LGGVDVNVLESTATHDGSLRLSLVPPLGVAGGVTAGESSEPGGSAEMLQDVSEWAGLAWGDCIGGRAGDAWAGKV
jgi:hypothetical protein